jgi:hypothetical protein
VVWADGGGNAPSDPMRWSRIEGMKFLRVITIAALLALFGGIAGFYVSIAVINGVFSKGHFTREEPGHPERDQAIILAGILIGAVAVPLGFDAANRSIRR